MHFSFILKAKILFPFWLFFDKKKLYFCFLLTLLNWLAVNVCTSFLIMTKQLDTRQKWVGCGEEKLVVFQNKISFRIRFKIKWIFFNGILLFLFFVFFNLLVSRSSKNDCYGNPFTLLTCQIWTYGLGPLSDILPNSSFFNVPLRKKSLESFCFFIFWFWVKFYFGKLHKTRFL